jgi:hypothetical protein
MLVDTVYWLQNTLNDVSRFTSPGGCEVTAWGYWQLICRFSGVYRIGFTPGFLSNVTVSIGNCLCITAAHLFLLGQVLVLRQSSLAASGTTVLVQPVVPQLYSLTVGRLCAAGASARSDSGIRDEPKRMATLATLRRRLATTSLQFRALSHSEHVRARERTQAQDLPRPPGWSHRGQDSLRRCSVSWRQLCPLGCVMHFSICDSTTALIHRTRMIEWPCKRLSHRHYDVPFALLCVPFHPHTPLPDLDRRVEELTKLCDGGWTTSKFAPADAAFDAGVGAPKLSALDVLALHVGGAHVAEWNKGAAPQMSRAHTVCVPVPVETGSCSIPASHTRFCCDLSCIFCVLFY